MLGFDSLATIPLAGSPLSAGSATGYVWSIDGGEYTLVAGQEGVSKTNVLSMDGGIYSIESLDTFLLRNRSYDLGGGVYTLIGVDARVFTSSFFYGDPEVFRVTPEVTLMRVLPEPRDMVTSGHDAEIVAVSDQSDAVVPRLRRT
jgi:hypothetical protein